MKNKNKIIMIVIATIIIISLVIVVLIVKNKSNKYIIKLYCIYKRIKHRNIKKY